MDVDAGGGDDGVDGAPGGDTSSNRGRSRSSARRGVGGAHAGRGASPSLLNTVAKLYNGRAKGGILNALRSYTTGSDPAANRDSKEGKRRRENEVRSLQHVRPADRFAAPPPCARCQLRLNTVRCPEGYIP